MALLENFRLRGIGTGPLPHPATQRYRTLWVAGWGSGPAQNDLEKKR